MVENTLLHVQKLLDELNPIWTLMIGSYTDLVTGS
jgi:hypothetical protein